MSTPTKDTSVSVRLDARTNERLMALLAHFNEREMDTIGPLSSISDVMRAGINDLHAKHIGVTAPPARP